MPDNNLPGNNLPDNGGVWPPPIASPTDAFNTQATGLLARHGCLTAWLVLTLLTQCAAIAWYITLSNINVPHASMPFLHAALYTAGCVGSIACVIALFCWRRWGFGGLAAIAVVVFRLNFAFRYGLVPPILGFGGLAMLYGLLNMGGANSAWRDMK